MTVAKRGRGYDGFKAILDIEGRRFENLDAPFLFTFSANHH